LDTSESPMDDRRRDELQEVIREAVKELLVIDGAAGISFPLDERTQISVGALQETPKILFDTPKRCVVVDGKECYTAEELWETAWAAERKVC
jgi:hypothetical protein